MPKKIAMPKETIVKVARELLETEGYSALSIRNLALKSGVSIGTIYNYFEDKRMLDVHLMTAFWSDFEESVDKICNSADLDFYEKMSQINAEMTRFVGQFKDLFTQVFESRNYSYSPHERKVKEHMVRRMTQSIEKAVLLECPELAQCSPDAVEIAGWILNSMMLVSHMHAMSYEELEKFIRKMMRP